MFPADALIDLDKVANIYLLFYRMAFSFLPPKPSLYPGGSWSNPQKISVINARIVSNIH